MWHLRVCRRPWKVKFDEANDHVLQKIVWGVQVYGKNAQVQAY
jgi:hypothetical protein